MLTSSPEVEKFVDTPKGKDESWDDYDKRGDKCPKCGEKGTTNVMPSTGGFWFCENPKCKVNRYFNGGYYITVKSNRKPVRILSSENRDDVQLVSIYCKKKHLNDKDPWEIK
jgi:ribosomal protein L37AE/L43A